MFQGKIWTIQSYDLYMMAYYKIIMMNQYSQKEKNQLVFKVLKSMNPFITDSKQKEKIKKQINNIFEEEQKKRVTFSI